MKLLSFLVCAFLLMYGYKSDCGRRLAGEGNVWGGKHSKINSWPWLVTIYDKRTNKFLCSGSLFKSNYVITGELIDGRSIKVAIIFGSVSAAHCFIPKHSRPEDIKSEFDIYVAVGKHNLLKENEEGSAVHDVERVYIHPDWNRTSLSYDADIAVLHLETDVDLTRSKSVRTICLPPPNEREVTGSGIAVGYGVSERSVADRERHDSTPNEVKLSIVPQSKCVEEYMFDQISSHRTFCAGVLKQEKNVCQGDSGGGFYQYDRSTRRSILIGIISASPSEISGGCNINTYSMYTDVSKFVGWIDEVVKKSDWTFVKLSITDE
jgi:secreted trypsin-like serine protease